jgi:hypothetical protein
MDHARCRRPGATCLARAITITAGLASCAVAACASEPDPAVPQNTAPPPIRLEPDPGFGRDGRVIFAPTVDGDEFNDVLPTGTSLPCRPFEPEMDGRSRVDDHRQVQLACHRQRRS